MRIYLTGFMGVGKTTVGRLVAGRLGWPFVDLDTLVETRADAAIARIFEDHGEARFRELESLCLRSTADAADCVVATGGGAAVDPRNREWMKDHGRIVWLDLPFERIVGRLARGAGRPLFRDRKAAEQLYEHRRDAYRDCDLRVDADRGSPDDLASDIVDELSLR